MEIPSLSATPASCAIRNSTRISDRQLSDFAPTIFAKGGIPGVSESTAS